MGRDFSDGKMRWQLLLEGPLTFVSEEGAGAHEAILRKGVPAIATEAKAALLSGKRLRKAKLSIALDNEEVWECKIDCQSFTFSSLKVPKSQEKNIDDRFEDNLRSMSKFMNIIRLSYNEFIKIRADKEAWRTEIKGINDWIMAKSVR